MPTNDITPHGFDHDTLEPGGTLTEGRTVPEATTGGPGLVLAFRGEAPFSMGRWFMLDGLDTLTFRRGGLLGLTPERATGKARLEFQDSTVSGRHAVLKLHPGSEQEACIMDLGSRNGTFVNGKRLTANPDLLPADGATADAPEAEPHPVADGDYIQIGRSVLIYRAEPPSLGATQTTKGPYLLLNPTTLMTPTAFRSCTARTFTGPVINTSMQTTPGGPLALNWRRFLKRSAS